MGGEQGNRFQIKREGCGSERAVGTLAGPEIGSCLPAGDSGVAWPGNGFRFQRLYQTLNSPGRSTHCTSVQQITDMR